MGSVGWSEIGGHYFQERDSKGGVVLRPKKVRRASIECSVVQHVVLSTGRVLRVSHRGVVGHK